MLDSAVNAFDRLGGEWFSDSLSSIGKKKRTKHFAAASWNGRACSNCKAEVEAIKQFLTKRADRYRAAYGKRPEEFKRQCIFIGTTNERDFLKDKTGNRRYWPVPVNRNRMTKTWRDLDKETVGQIWAEAVTLYKAGEPLFLEGEEEAAAAAMQQSHTEESPYFGLIQDFLERKLPKNWDELDLVSRQQFIHGEDIEDDDQGGSKQDLVDREKVCALEIWCELFRNDMRRFNAERREINDCLRRIPGWKAYDNSKSGNMRFGKLYGLQRAYVRK